MARLRLAFLGPPEVWCGEQRLHFATRKALALLIYLAVEGGWHPREKLIALFWPERDAAGGRGVLRTTLAYLRRALAPTGRTHLLHEGDALSFDTAGTELDLHVLARALPQAEAPSLQAAVDVYRGDFLEAFSLPDAPAFEEWATLHRERYHHHMNLILGQLSRQQLEQREWVSALATISRWLAHDALQELAYQRFIQLHLFRGDRTAALQAYEQCRQVLKTELGLDPSVETQRLAAQIQKIATAVQEPAHASGDPASKLTLQPSTFSLPFTGRASEYAHLTAAYRACCQGKAQVVVITGEAGIGKTRLATEFLHWAAVQGADVLVGRTIERSGRLPYQPLVDALRPRMDQENAPEDLLSDIWLAELSRLLPELRDRYPDLPPPTADANLAPSRLLETVAQLVQALAARRPLVLFLDDVQWADAATLDVIPYLGRHSAQRRLPLLLLLTIRAEDLAITPLLHAWLSGLERELPLTQRHLPPLSDAETHLLVAALIEAQNETFAQWLFTETAGQPFYISETCRMLVERDVLSPPPGAEGKWQVDVDHVRWQGLVPPSVRRVILARLKTLSSGALDLLTAAAVLARNCRFERLCQVANLAEEDKALAVLDELLHSYLLSSSGDSAHPYRCAHDKIRDVVYTEAGDARRRIYHRRAFTVLEKATAPPAELAHHALAAHLSESAFRYSLAAGDEAMSLFAIRDAIAHYEQARALSNTSLSIDEDQGQHLYARLSRAYELLGEHAQAEAICREMLAQAQAWNRLGMAGMALNRLASLAIYTHHLDEAAAWLDQAHALAITGEDNVALAQTEWSLGQLAHHRGHLQTSKEHAKRALALARELDDASLIAGTLNTLGFAQLLLGDVTTGESTLAEAASRFRILGNKALEADSLVGLAATRLLGGKLAAGIEAARTAYRLGAQIENEFGQSMSRSWLIFGLVDGGMYAEALELALENMAASRRQGGPPLLLASFSLGLIYQALGRMAEARAAHREGASVSEASGVKSYLAQSATNFCVDAVLAGDWVAAGDYAEQALIYQEYKTIPLIYAPLWPVTAALLHVGAIDVARTDLSRWEKRIGQVPRYRLSHLRSLALLAEWEGKVDQALIHLEEAVTLSAHMGLPGERWPILAKLGELFLAVGDEAKARVVKSQAVAVVDHLAEKVGDEAFKATFLDAAGRFLYAE